MDVITLANGWTIKCTEKENSYGQTVVTMMDLISMTKKKDKELLSGQMRKNTKEIGQATDKMALDS